MIAPVALFVLGVTMASCGGGSTCFGSFNSRGQFIAGLCPTASPSPGFALSAINICPGPPPPTQTPTASNAPTATPTACALATSTAVSGSGVSISFNAQAVLVRGSQTTYADITNSVSTLWTSNNNPPGGPEVLQPPTTTNGGVYTGLNDGCACIKASSGGINAQPVTVGVGPGGNACALCPTFTPTPTATATPKGATAQVSSADPSSLGGTLLWTFDGHAPVDGQIAAAPDGSADFISADGMLHSIDLNGHEVFDRPAGGIAPAVGPDGTIYVQGTTSWVYALDPAGRPRWKLNVGTGTGPLAADSNAVYANENGNLVALAAGQTLWSVPLGTLSRGAITPDGVVVASSGALTALSSSGSTLWTFTPAGGFSGNLAVANGTVYCGSGSGTVYALVARSGSVVLQIASGAPVTSGPVVSGSGSIYFGSDALYAIDSSGTALWSSNAVIPVGHGIAATSNGGVFDAASSGSASMIDGSGNIQWTARDLGSVAQVTAGPSGAVFVASSNGTVRALK